MSPNKRSQRFSRSLLNFESAGSDCCSRANSFDSQNAQVLELFFCVRLEGSRSS